MLIFEKFFCRLKVKDLALKFKKIVKIGQKKSKKKTMRYNRFKSLTS